MQSILVFRANKERWNCVSASANDKSGGGGWVDGASRKKTRRGNSGDAIARKDSHASASSETTTNAIIDQGHSAIGSNSIASQSQMESQSQSQSQSQQAITQDDAVLNSQMLPSVACGDFDPTKGENSEELLDLLRGVLEGDEE